jgi:hypothetical protein
LEAFSQSGFPAPNFPEKKFNSRLVVTSSFSSIVRLLISEPSKNLRHSRTADPEIASKVRTILELPGVEQRPVVAGELERIAWFGRSRFEGFWGAGTVPGVKGNDSRST